MGSRESEIARLTERVWQVERRIEDLGDELEIMARARVADLARSRRKTVEALVAVVVLLHLTETDASDASV